MIKAAAVSSRVVEHTETTLASCSDALGTRRVRPAAESHCSALRHPTTRVVQLDYSNQSSFYACFPKKLN